MREVHPLDDLHFEVLDLLGQKHAPLRWHCHLSELALLDLLLYEELSRQQVTPSGKQVVSEVELYPWVWVLWKELKYCHSVGLSDEILQIFELEQREWFMNEEGVVVEVRDKVEV